MERCEITGRIKRIELNIGARYNKWEVLKFSHKGSGGNLFWSCKCEGGVVKTVIWR